MRVTETRITPRQAREWLERSAQIKQRNLSRTRIERYAGDMAAGRFELTHQPIAIDPNGLVFDGQHRLSAIVLSKTTVTLMVAYDADPTTFGKIDLGMPRTPSAILALAGYVDSSALAASARLLIAYDRMTQDGTPPSAAARHVTVAEIQSLVESERGQRLDLARHPAARISKAIGRQGVRTPMGTCIVIINESRVGASTRADFFERLADGAMLAPLSPVLAFRRWVGGDSGFVSVPSQERSLHFVANCIKTFNDWINGRERKTVTWRPSANEPMPIIKRERNAHDDPENDSIDVV